MKNFKHFLKEGLHPVTVFKIEVAIEVGVKTMEPDQEFDKHTFHSPVDKLNSIKDNFEHQFSLKRTNDYEEDDFSTMLGAKSSTHEIEMSFPLIQSADCLKLRNGFIDQLRAEFGSETEIEINSLVWINLPFKGIVVENVDNVFIEANSPTSLTNIHKMIPSIVLDKKSKYSNIHVRADGFSEVVFTTGTLPYIQSNALGILLIKGNFSIHSNSNVLAADAWFDIMKKHLAGERDLLECKVELIEKGFSAYAKL
ncbi:MAG: hypothetical protein QXN55_01740 [Candidatus Nitrosotenuis sp.]